MKKMYIVEWSNDYHETAQIKTCEDQAEILHMVGTHSSSKYFMIHRINLYEKGKLHPYKLELINGKITLKITLMEMEDSK